MSSIWEQTVRREDRPPLAGDIQVQAVVIGGGMAGILTAKELAGRGVHTVVLEAGRLGGGQTGRTTAKITAQHGLCYAKLIDRFGAQDALRYARAARQAVTDFRDIIAQEHIACHLETLPSYLYSRYDPTTLKQERDAACDLGFGAEFVKETCLPFPVEGSALYYVGPTPERPGQVIGSAGPTTSGRMDAYSPRLLDLGQSIMIGKGARNQAVKDAVVRSGAVYLAALGGAGALMAASVESLEVICWEDLGCEAVRRLEVKDFPLTVILDAHGGDLYQAGPEAYLAAQK